MKKVMLAMFALSLMACSNEIYRDGRNGDPGPAGPKGDSCTVTPALDNSGALISCGNGSSVFVKNGANGSNGSNGTNAVPVEFIKFCPASVPSYGNFPEYGIKVETKIYAVYSANNGFLTLLSPGTYVTASTGLNCNFTVTTTGTVTN